MKDTLKKTDLIKSKIDAFRSIDAHLLKLNITGDGIQATSHLIVAMKKMGVFHQRTVSGLY